MKKSPKQQALIAKVDAELKAAGLAKYSDLVALGNEYDRCIRHMDAGGDFTSFQVQVSRENGVFN